jgi:hypothetical protein
VQNHSSVFGSNRTRLQLQRLQNSFELGGYDVLDSFMLIATKSLLLFGAEMRCVDSYSSYRMLKLT